MIEQDKQGNNGASKDWARKKVWSSLTCGASLLQIPLGGGSDVTVRPKIQDSVRLQRVCAQSVANR